MNRLIKEDRKKRLAFKNNKRIKYNQDIYETVYATEIINHNDFQDVCRNYFKLGWHQITNEAGKIIYFNEKQIEQMNSLLTSCYSISWNNNVSILDGLPRDPDIDEIDRPNRWNLIDRMDFCLYEIWPDEYYTEAFPCTLR